MEKNVEIKICRRCVMDTTDTNIKFDDQGYCNHCTEALKNKVKIWFPNQQGEEKLTSLVKKIKNSNKNNKYDCIIGISGGIDSSYLAYTMKDKGLKMLGVHIDAGFNTDISIRNIEKLCKIFNIELYVHKIDLDEMMDLQRAYFRAEVKNQDVPQDHAFFCALYKLAYKEKIEYFLSGGNFTSESILPLSWGYNATDNVNLKDIHAKYGTAPLKTYPTMSFYDYYVKYPNLGNLKKIRPLNYIDYDKEKSINILHEKIGFEYYGAKHCESSFTRLYQNYILPRKFNVDKRKAHLSSLIVAEQLTRNEALEILAEPFYTNIELMEEDINNFINKIKITRKEFDDNINRFGGRSHYDFKNNAKLFKLKDKVKNLIGL